jgi:hypothetical protein
MKKHHKIMSDEIAIYQSKDGKIELNVKIKNDNIWLAQKQIAELFGTKIPAITKHLNNKELDKKSTISILEIVQKEGNRNVIGSFLFIVFLTKNHALQKQNGRKIFDDSSLVSLALLIAESNPKQKELMIKLITNLITK